MMCAKEGRLCLKMEIKQDPSSTTRQTPKFASIADMSRQHEFRLIEKKPERKGSVSLCSAPVLDSLQNVHRLINQISFLEPTGFQKITCWLLHDSPEDADYWSRGARWLNPRFVSPIDPLSLLLATRSSLPPSFSLRNPAWRARTLPLSSHT